MPDTISATTHDFETSDGTRLVWHEMGKGRPVLLLHGLFSNAYVNWIKFGTAQRLVEAGLRPMMLDFRAHGDSGAPEDAARWPANILALDVMEWTEHLALDDYDLAGFSLGGRTAVLSAIEGLAPRRLAICGMGLKGIADQQSGTDWFIDVVERRDEHPRGSDEYFAVQFMKTNKVDPDAALHLLRAQVNAAEADIAAIDTPALVLCATEDRYFADAQRLAALMPGAAFESFPGNHMSCVSKPEFGDKLAAFLSA